MAGNKLIRGKRGSIGEKLTCWNKCHNQHVLTEPNADERNNEPIVFHIKITKHAKAYALHLADGSTYIISKVSSEILHCNALCNSVAVKAVRINIKCSLFRQK